MASLTLKAKFRALFLIVTVLFAGLGAFSINRMALVNDRSTVMAELWTPRVEKAGAINTATSDYRIIEARHILSTTPELLAESDRDIETQLAAIRKLMEEYKQLLRPEDSPAAFAKFSQEWDAYVAGGQPMLQLSRANANAEAAEAFKNRKAAFDALSKTVTELGLADMEAADAESAEGDKVYAAVRASLIAILAGLVAACVAAAVYFERSVSNVLNRLSVKMRALANQDFSVEVEGVKRGDEVGEMARSVEVFKTNGLEMKRLEGEAEIQRAAQEKERAQNEEARAKAAREQEQVVRSVAGGLERLSDGQLTFRLSDAFPADYEQLRSDFNAAMDKLQQTMGMVVGNTGAIGSGTAEISQAADDLSRRTEQQAASLEETAAALDEITATVRKTADGAQHARETVTTARTDAERSGEVVRDAVAAMTAIQQSSQQIGQIIGVIDEIAFQTNLLALNAGVEAARAGEAGRGFAVVASEVRALAQRSAEAAKEIKTLISASTQQVSQGVVLVNQTGEALQRIVTQVSDISAVVSEIAASAQEQATGLQQVNTAVNQMDQVTQQNAAMVEESTAASHSLAQEAESLKTLMAQFVIGSEARATAPAVKPKPAAAVSPARKQQQRLAAAFPTQGSAALKAAPAEADGWEEF